MVIGMKFKVGDIVTGKASADRRYSYTTSKATMRVVGVDAYEIDVCILSHETMKHLEGDIHCVNPKHFTLINSVAKSNYIEEE